MKSFFESKIDKEKYGLDIYLQGSYGNNTNIEDESDVDIVIEMNKVYYYNIDSLTTIEQEKFNSEHPS
ncbi:nucleotidyltransferase domain-containing protein, partial [Methanobrevibacter sp.]|uniref:nucleotidyltransferase domain-containing protein n=1 Tax=Methanobrevibacter sp. TaxID=66852 RepID=UPI00388E63B5